MADPQKPIDPWEQEAANFKASPHTASSPSKTPDDDWKIWQQGAQASHDQPVERTPLNYAMAAGRGVASGAKDFGGGLVNAIRHPIDTGKAMVGQVKDFGNAMTTDQPEDSWQGHALHMAENLPVVGGYVKQAELGSQPKMTTPASQNGGYETNYASPESVEAGTRAATSLAVLPKVAPALKPTGKGLQSAGTGLLNKTVGALKNDLNHGANPAFGYLEGGGKPSWTMGGLAEKAENITDATGKKLGEAYDKSPVRIPHDAVAKVIDEPINKLETLQTGPGGTGLSPALENYRNQMQPPIQAAQARGGFTPRELFDEMKQPIAKSTNWKDPTMFDLNTVRQQNTGGIGGLLTDAVPEIAPLNKVYQGANNFARRADYRSNTGQTPLSQIGRRVLEGGAGGALGYATGHPLAGVIPMALDTVPVKSAAAYVMYHAGKGLARVPDLSSTSLPTSALAGINEEKPDEKKKK